MNPIFVFLAGLAGATGIAFAATAVHGPAGPTGSSAALVLLAGAPALLAIGLRPPGTLLLDLGGGVIALGMALFAGDMAMRQFGSGHALFPMAAPTGGGAMIAGWLLVALAGLFSRRG
jgi:uncharacterized membrane protein YgdD (TMEM256/DUF423 family)